MHAVLKASKQTKNFTIKFKQKGPLHSPLPNINLSEGACCDFLHNDRLLFDRIQFINCILLLIGDLVTSAAKLLLIAVLLFYHDLSVLQGYDRLQCLSAKVRRRSDVGHLGYPPQTVEDKDSMYVSSHPLACSLMALINKSYSFKAKYSRKKAVFQTTRFKFVSRYAHP